MNRLVTYEDLWLSCAALNGLSLPRISIHPSVHHGRLVTGDMAQISITNELHAANPPGWPLPILDEEMQILASRGGS